MWLYVAVAAGIVSAIAVPLVAGVRVAVSWSDARRPDLDRDELAPELRALIDRYG